METRSSPSIIAKQNSKGSEIQNQNWPSRSLWRYIHQGWRLELIHLSLLYTYIFKLFNIEAYGMRPSFALLPGSCEYWWWACLQPGKGQSWWEPNPALSSAKGKCFRVPHGAWPHREVRDRNRAAKYFMEMILFYRHYHWQFPITGPELLRAYRGALGKPPTPPGISSRL